MWTRREQQAFRLDNFQFLIFRTRLPTTKRRVRTKKSNSGKPSNSLWPQMVARRRRSQRRKMISWM